MSLELEEVGSTALRRERVTTLDRCPAQRRPFIATRLGTCFLNAAPTFSNSRIKSRSRFLPSLQ